jgi:tRNA dimethylallyltransferase
LDKKPVLVCVLGPTASGKSEVAVSLAETVSGEIVSCDSMQVYRGMNVLTQAPGRDLLERARHHLVGVISPEEEFNAARFVEITVRAVDGIILRGNVPILSGGTGLYVKSLLEGLFPAPSGNKEFREKLEQEAAEKGKGYVYEKLRKIDPESAFKIDPENLRRVIRALEVFELTGKTFSEKKTETRGIGGKYDCRLFALRVERQVLINRINKRVEDMFSSGLIEEVEKLMGQNLSRTASKALGIKEVLEYSLGEKSIEEAKEALKIKTRQYAKRQMTWLRAVEGIEWIDSERPLEHTASDIALRAGLTMRNTGSET